MAMSDFGRMFGGLGAAGMAGSLAAAPFTGGISLLPTLISAGAGLLGSGISAAGSGMAAAQQSELQQKQYQEQLDLQKKKMMMDQANQNRSFGMQGFQNFLGLNAKSDADARVRIFRKGLAQMATSGAQGGV